MTQPAIRAAEILAESGAVLSGIHAVYTSGRHGSAYVNKDAIYPHTERVSELCRLMGEAARPFRPEVVCGPAMGGIILSQWTAHHLGVLGVYAEKVAAGGLELRRGYDKVVAGRRVLVVEDILNTGGSLRDAVVAVQAAGGQVVAATALCNRGGVRAADVGVTALTSLVDLVLESWEPAECPLCQREVPVNTDVGKGREFLAARAG
ncbi:MAG TPA: phosphoribosyltransferase family protein [Candidatus Binatia bacterium]|jgi:orotate phosphoribosyltransferase|nr:phosphoribosyltransferase family protein [Candidatus Binatia bacterium]